MTQVLFNKNFSVTAAQIQALRGSPYTVWASHTDPCHGMLAAATHTLLEPRGPLNDDYAQWLLERCLEHGITILVAGKERETLASWQGRFAEQGIQLLVPASAETQRLLSHKSEFLADWDTAILPIPAWHSFQSLAEFEAGVERLQQPGIRLCLKPARGIYASGFRILEEQPDLKGFLRGELYTMSFGAARELLASAELPPMLLMHTLEGVERSIDAVAWEGRLIRAVVRRKGGSGQVIEERPDLIWAAQLIAQRYQLSGIFNFQTKDQNDIPHMLEINARTSGGLKYSMAAGVNFARLLLDAASGRLDWNDLPEVQTGLTVYAEKGVRVCS